MNIKEFANFYKISPTLTDVDIIKEFLMREYGEILPKIERASDVKLEQLHIVAIDAHFDRINQLKTENLDIPIIVLKRENYWLIDGYHRLAKKIIENKKIDGEILKSFSSLIEDKTKIIIIPIKTKDKCLKKIA